MLPRTVKRAELRACIAEMRDNCVPDAKSLVDSGSSSCGLWT